MSDHPVLQKIGMDMDDASNGWFLRTPAEDISTMSRHRGYHSIYNEFVRSQLDKIEYPKRESVIGKLAEATEKVSPTISSHKHKEAER